MISPRSLGLLILLAFTAPWPTWAASAEKTVLVIYAEWRFLPAIMAVDQEIVSLSPTPSTSPIRFYTEYLDLSWFPDQRVERALLETLRLKYASRSLDLVIPVGPTALRFALLNRSKIFAGVPIVFAAGLESRVGDLSLGPDVTGVWMVPEWQANLDLVLRLHPDTRRLAFVYGTSAFDRAEVRRFREAFSGYRGRIELIELTDLPFDQLLGKLAALPEQTVVMFATLLRDATGRTFVPAEAVAAISRATRAPVYGLSDTFLGRGIVGGRVISFTEQGRRAAALALRVLNGERLGPADANGPEANAYKFDARQLRRWNIDEGRLPPGSVVAYRDSSVWELYRWHIVGGLAVVGLEALLIVGLLVQRAQRTRAQRALAQGLRFEQLVAEMSTAFASLPPADVEMQIQKALSRILDELGFDRGSLMEFAADLRLVRVTHSIRAKGVAPLPATFEVERFPWTFGELRRGNVVRFSRLGELPADATKDRDSFLAFGTRSMVAVPLAVAETVIGGLAFATVGSERDWPHGLVQRLRLLGEIFGNALVRQRAEGAVRESEDRFRLIADTAPMMVWMAGRDGRCTYFNKGWLDFTGRGLEEELGEGWAEGVHPDDRPRCLDDYRRAFDARQEFILEYRLRHRDGAYRWILDHGVPRHASDGSFSGYVGSCTDITPLKAAQQAMLESIELRSAIFGSLYGHVAAIDRDGVIVAVNESWARFAEADGGDSARLPVGANYLAALRQAAIAGDVHAQHALEAIRSVLEGRTLRESLEYPVKSAAHERWFEMAVEPFRRPEGGAVISQVDITRRRSAEAEARRQRGELAHALRVTTLGELAGSLAHEISQPLAAIVSNAQAARLVLASERLDHDELRGALTDIAQDARRAAQVIRRVRTLFRKEWADRKPIDVNALITEVTSLLHGDMESKGVSVTLALAKDLPSVLGDAIQLQQILLNVLLNAGEAMASLSPGAQAVTIETARRDPGTLEITVRDTGPGIGSGDLELIFQPFVTTKATGLGMGLSISRSIIQAHGGRIWATQNDDCGLTVHVELPYDEDEHA